MPVLDGASVGGDVLSSIGASALVGVDCGGDGVPFIALVAVGVALTGVPAAAGVGVAVAGRAALDVSSGAAGGKIATATRPGRSPPRWSGSAASAASGFSGGNSGISPTFQGR
jgi:hypothetical protein